MKMGYLWGPSTYERSALLVASRGTTSRGERRGGDEREGEKLFVGLWPPLDVSDFLSISFVSFLPHVFNFIPATFLLRL